MPILSSGAARALNYQLLVSSNASFETGVSPWTSVNSASLAQSANWAEQGSYSLRITGATGTASPGAQSEFLPVTAGIGYLAEVYFYSPQGWPQVQLSINWYDGSHNPVGSPAQSSIVSLVASEAQRLDVNGIAPTGSVWAKLEAQMLGTPTQAVPLGTTFGAYLDATQYGYHFSDVAAAISKYQQVTGTTVACRRVYYPPKDFPVGLADQNLDDDLAANRLVLLSFKVDYNPVSADQLSRLNRFLKLCKQSGLNAKVTMYHEPGTEGLTSTQYKAMMAYYGPTVRQYYPLIYCQSGWYIGAHPGSANDYYPGDSLIDEIAVDFYASAYINHGYTLDPMLAIADAASPKKPFGLWEFGANDPGTYSWTDIDRYFTYVQTTFQQRYRAGKPVGDLAWFNAPGQAGNSSVFTDPDDQLVAQYEALYDALAGTSTQTVELYIDAFPRNPTPVPVPTPPPPPPQPIDTRHFVLVRHRLPRLMAQDPLTGEWQHRDIHGYTQPVITRTLNGADTFTCTLQPVRSDLIDSTPELLLRQWGTTLYLEEDSSIKFGGLITDGQQQGDQWQLTATGYSGYPNGIPYVSGKYSRTNYDAFQVVRDMWDYIQDRPNGNLNVIVDSGSCGVQVGAQTQLVTVTVRDKKTHQVKTKQVRQAIPFVLDWWNATDIGSELAQLAAEIPFDWTEEHSWADSSQQSVVHRLRLGHPRIGVRRSELRFVEEENVLPSPIVTWSSSSNSAANTSSFGTYANEIIGFGAGSGSKMLRHETYDLGDGRVRRPLVYQNQTIHRPERLKRVVEHQLQAAHVSDNVTQAIVRDHPNAPFGSFGIGDDILVELTTGWRVGKRVWCRILQTSQDPTTSVMTLTLSRSDSFTYQAATGTGGTF